MQFGLMDFSIGWMKFSLVVADPNMIVIFTLRLLYGITYIEISEQYMVTYNIYENSEQCKDATLYDFNKELAFTINLEDCNYNVMSFERLINQNKNELLSSKKLNTLCFRDIYDIELFLEEYKVAFNKLNSATMPLQIKKAYGNIPALELLQLDKNHYSLIPYIGSSYLINSLFTFSCFEVNNLNEENNDILVYKIDDIEYVKTFSDQAMEIIKVIEK